MPKGRSEASRSAARAVAMILLAVAAAGLVNGGGCARQQPEATPQAATTPAAGEYPKTLSEYQLFAGNPADQVPADGVVPYDLNTPLFSDYAHKFRFVKLPAGQKAMYNDSDVFVFPVGTIIAKTFDYPADQRDESKGRRLIETRILWHRDDGWVGLPYVWNEEQTEATLKLAGKLVDVEWIHADGQQRTNNHIVPNANQCQGCHTADGPAVQPIGPKARHLNRDFVYHDGTQENQLAHWAKASILAGAPTEPAAAPRVAVWDDPDSGTLDERARAYLDINCGHCHNPSGPAKSSGLHLDYAQSNPTVLGVMKMPVAAGRASADLKFDIVPGEPDRSILAHRMAAEKPGIMMPELGKRLVHPEGVALIREWIAAMPAETAAAQ